MILSPAKVNLFLRILSRRTDGYHEIASLFQAVNLFDRLHYSFAEKDRLTSSDPFLLCDQSNLIMKALNAFRQASGLHFCLNIHLEKNIPMEAGLGGGSGNAATMLFLCNALHGFPLSEKDLATIGATIGSDVAFFFSKGSAYCTGRGEIFQSIDHFETKKKIWLVKPNYGLSTKLIFNQLKLERCSTMIPLTLLENCLSGLFVGINDLEESAFGLVPELKYLKNDLLDQGFESVFMTGSGTALVCIGENRPIVETQATCYSVSFVQRKEGQWYE